MDNVLPPLDDAEVRTVLDLAAHMNQLRVESITLQATLAATARGYFTPSEDDQVLYLWVSYHKSRAALFDLINSIRDDVGKAVGEQLGEFAIAYAAALVLVDIARSLRDAFRQHGLVRAKLNESYQSFGIPSGSYDAIQMSLTAPANVLAIRDASEFYRQHQELLAAQASRDAGWKSIVGVIDRLEKSTNVSTIRYVHARLRDRGRDARDRIVANSVMRMVYAIQELGGRLVSHLSVRPTYTPQLPRKISDELLNVIQPGDVFVTRKDAAITNYFLPGYWPHAAMFIGKGRVIESLKDGVRERTLDSPWGNDALAVIRPCVNAATIQQAIERARSHVGKPYDFGFDFTRADRMVCTEVVYRSFEGLDGLQFKLTRRAGRETLSAEDLLSLAVAGHLFEQVVIYCRPFGDKLLVGEKMADVLRTTMADSRQT